MPLIGFDLSELRFLAARVLLRGLLRLCFQIQVRGLEQVPDRGYVAVANHLNWIDGFLLLAYLPQRPRLFVLGDMQGVYKHGWWKAFLALVGRVIPIDRHGPGGIRAGLDACNEVLRRGDALALFPEGGMGLGEGAMAPLRPGVGALWLRSGLPVLPIGISGASELYLGRRITVNIGRVFSPQAERSSFKTAVDSVTHQVQTALQAALPAYSEPVGDRKRCRWLTDLLT